MSILELADSRFLLGKFCSRLIELASEKAGRVLRAYLALLRVFANEQISELGSGELSHFRIAIGIRNIKGRESLVVAPNQLDVYIRTHFLDNLIRVLAFSLLRVQVEAFDDVDQAGAA